MTLRTKTLSAVSALLIGASGAVWAQDSQQADTAADPATLPLTTEADSAVAPETTAGDIAPAETVTEEVAPAADDAAAEEAADQQDAPAATEAAPEEAEAEAPADPETPVTSEADNAAAQETTAGDAAPAETVAEQEASEELQADQSADQTEAEEVVQDEAAPAADDAAIEETTAEQDAPAGTEAETASEEVEAAAPTEAVGETSAEADAAAEHAVAEEEHAAAAGAHTVAHIEDVAFSFEGPFGKYDQFQLQRGLQVYTEVCSACHGLRYVPLRTLGDEGGPALPEDQVRAYAAQMDIFDPELDDDRPRLPTDHFPTVTGDGMGPDLSLMAKARAGFHGPAGTGINQLINGIGGPEYIHAILTGYTGEEIEQAGTVLYENTAFSTGYIGMPAPLFDDLVTYEDGTPATLDQMAKDVSAFLMWTAEPKMMDRKQVGFVSVLFLIVLSVLLYLTNKRIWAPHKGKH